MANELVLKISADSQGNAVNLNSIPIEAADALAVFLNSLKELAKLHDNPTEVKLSLRNGSIESVLEYPETDTELDIGIANVIEGRSSNNEYFKLLRDIQDTIKANGLTYEVVHKVSNTPRNLTAEFKAKNFVRRQGSRKKKEEEVVFLKGKLFESGGKRSTNIHLDVDDVDIKVECTQGQAIRLNKLLYSEIRLCALKKSKPGKHPSYLLLDSYASEESFRIFKDIHDSVNNETLERFDVIYNRVIEAIERPKVKGEIVKLLRLFKYPQVDRGIVRTILIALKPIRTQETVVETYKELAGILRNGSTHKVI